MERFNFLGSSDDLGKYGLSLSYTKRYTRVSMMRPCRRGPTHTREASPAPARMYVYICMYVCVCVYVCVCKCMYACRWHQCTDRRPHPCMRVRSRYTRYTYKCSRDPPTAVLDARARARTLLSPAVTQISIYRRGRAAPRPAPAYTGARLQIFVALWRL